MSTASPPRVGVDAVELGRLLSAAVEAVVTAQKGLDDYTLSRARDCEAAAPGELAIPPLWFAFRDVVVEFEMSARVARVADDSGVSQIVCRTLEPTSVGLYGYQASSGLRVRVALAPQGFATVRPPIDPGPR